MADFVVTPRVSCWLRTVAGALCLLVAAVFSVTATASANSPAGEDNDQPVKSAHTHLTRSQLVVTTRYRVDKSNGFKTLIVYIDTRAGNHGPDFRFRNDRPHVLFPTKSGGRWTQAYVGTTMTCKGLKLRQSRSGVWETSTVKVPRRCLKLSGVVPKRVRVTVAHLWVDNEGCSPSGWSPRFKHLPTRWVHIGGSFTSTRNVYAFDGSDC